ncbi:hypothetical protein EZV62_015714 [Acer yangbiense]|uniref:Uncharacterized protein n=1 Tax=Acer yangbiense TaxID=1000413 RepID=A0A5C7HM98_9ROSI|nr:hypothetical protein EZV62_015714 [Acer yangbiense]
MSDRQKGVIAALEINFPFVHRRYCARHIYANFKLTYKGDHYKKLFWRAARSSNIYDFQSSMEEISTHRAKSYLDLLEFIRRMVMRKFNERKEECRGWSLVLPPRVHAKIMRHGRESSHYCGGAAVKDKVAEFVHGSLTKNTEHMNPPLHTVQLGRPRKQRKREPNEAPKVRRSGTVICKLCRQAGHNKRSCQRRKDN